EEIGADVIADRVAGAGDADLIEVDRGKRPRLLLQFLEDLLVVHEAGDGDFEGQQRLEFLPQRGVVAADAVQVLRAGRAGETASLVENGFEPESRRCHRTCAFQARSGPSDSLRRELDRGESDPNAKA